MTEKEYTPPTDEQLANFLTIDAQNDPRTRHLGVRADILLHLIQTNEKFRIAGIIRHKRFVDMINRHTEAMKQGKLQCEYIRPNGKRCVNFNVPGTLYCGIESHQPEGSNGSKPRAGGV